MMEKSVPKTAAEAAYDAIELLEVRLGKSLAAGDAIRDELVRCKELMNEAVNAYDEETKPLRAGRPDGSQTNET